MKSIPVTIVHSFYWLNRGALHHDANDEIIGNGWLGLNTGEDVACGHHGEKVAFYTDDLVSMYQVCQDCGQSLAEEF
jgi:hypothetical protein